MAASWRRISDGRFFSVVFNSAREILRRSHDVRVYDESGNVIETHEHAGQGGILVGAWYIPGLFALGDHSQLLQSREDQTSQLSNPPQLLINS